MLHAASTHNIMWNMQLSSQMLAFGRICYAIKQYMHLSNMQLTVQFSYLMAGIG